MHDMTRTAVNVQNKDLVNGFGIENSMTQGLAKNVVHTLELSPVTLPARRGTIGPDNSVSDNLLSAQLEERLGTEMCMVQGLATESVGTLELCHKLVPETSGTTKTNKGVAATEETLHSEQGFGKG